MIDRDGRIVFGAFLLFVLVLAGSVLVELQYGVALRDDPVASFVVFAGIAVAAPQLYLAAADDQVPARIRIQFAGVATAVFAIVFAGNATGVRYLVIAGAGAVAIFGLVSYELLTWYRDSDDGGAVRVR